MWIWLLVLVMKDLQKNIEKLNKSKKLPWKSHEDVVVVKCLFAVFFPFFELVDNWFVVQVGCGVRQQFEHCLTFTQKMRKIRGTHFFKFSRKLDIKFRKFQKEFWKWPSLIWLVEIFAVVYINAQISRERLFGSYHRTLLSPLELKQCYLNLTFQISERKNSHDIG